MVYTGNADFLASTSAATTFVVNPAALTVTALDQSRTYGDINPAFSYTITGSSAATSSTSPGSPAHRSFTTTAVDRTSPAGVYPITVTRGTLAYADPNYAFDPSAFQGGKADDPAGASDGRPQPALLLPDPALWPGQSRPDRPQPGRLQLHRLRERREPGRSLTGTPSASTLAIRQSTVGSYPITVKAGTLWSPNYTFTFKDGSLTVTAGGPDGHDASRPDLRLHDRGHAELCDHRVRQRRVGGDQRCDRHARRRDLDHGGKPRRDLLRHAGPGTLKSTNYTFTFTAGAATLHITPAQLTVAANDPNRSTVSPILELTYTITGSSTARPRPPAACPATPLLSTTAADGQPRRNLSDHGPARHAGGEQLRVRDRDELRHADGQSGPADRQGP